MALIYGGNIRAGVPINKRINLYFILIVVDGEGFVKWYLAEAIEQISGRRLWFTTFPSPSRPRPSRRRSHFSKTP